MIYWIWLRDRRGNAYAYQDSFIPGLVIQERVINQTSVDFAEEFGICEHCDGRICHVIEAPTGKKYCPILFHDVVKPKWKLESVIR